MVVLVALAFTTDQGDIPFVADIDALRTASISSTRTKSLSTVSLTGRSWIVTVLSSSALSVMTRTKPRCISTLRWVLTVVTPRSPNGYYRGLIDRPRMGNLWGPGRV